MQTIISKRSSGVLMHITSLPGKYGIGDLGGSCRDFIDFLAASGQSCWQVLPLGPVNAIFGNSPYTSCSAFAGNPLLISPDLLIQEGYIQAPDLPPFNFSEYEVDFEKVKAWKKQILAVTWRTFQANSNRHNLDEFIQNNPWIRDYGLFMALKHKFNQQDWLRWPARLRHREQAALKEAENELQGEIRYFQFEQYLFFHQWRKIHDYAAKKGIRLIGDLPVYAGLDSTDVWANQDIFELDPESCQPISVAGVPPDYFSSNGQRWGNPLYRWNTKNSAVKKQLFNWWVNRFEMIFSTVDIIRIDHFRGFESYWSVPSTEKTAIKGSWKKGPGRKFFVEMEKRLGSLPIIAEDLGIITPAVEKLRDDLGFPGMKILLFAFDGNADNSYLPYNYEKNCVVYSGTHDNDTAVGWYLSPDVSPDAKRQAKRYANCMDNEAANFHLQMMYLAHSSTADLAILPMQDILGFGNDCRMNIPGTATDNWKWRCAERFMTPELSRRLYESTRRFGRLPAAGKEGSDKK